MIYLKYAEVLTKGRRVSERLGPTPPALDDERLVAVLSIDHEGWKLCVDVTDPRHYAIVYAFNTSAGTNYPVELYWLPEEDRATPKKTKDYALHPAL